MPLPGTDVSLPGGPLGARYREFLVADARGSVFLTDWRTDPDENEAASWRNSSVVELVEPRARLVRLGLRLAQRLLLRFEPIRQAEMRLLLGRELARELAELAQLTNSAQGVFALG